MVVWDVHVQCSTYQGMHQRNTCHSHLQQLGSIVLSRIFQGVGLRVQETLKQSSRAIQQRASFHAAVFVQNWVSL